MYQRPLLTEGGAPVAQYSDHWDTYPSMREVIEGVIAPVDDDHGGIVMAFALLVMAAKELQDSRGREDYLAAMLRDRCGWMDKEVGRFMRWRSPYNKSKRAQKQEWLLSERKEQSLGRDYIRLKFSRKSLDLRAVHGRRLGCFRFIYLPSLPKWHPLMSAAIWGCRRRSDEIDLMRLARQWIDEQLPGPLLLAIWRHPDTPILTDYAAEHWPSLADDFWEWLGGEG